jgi:hypothetical protein
MNNFKNSMGRPLMKALFYEMVPGQPETCVYTLKDEDHVVGDITYPSLYRLYMEMEDIVEWEFAHKYLSGWAHWETLCESPFFKPYIKRWRKELELMLKTRFLKDIELESKSSSKNAYYASKYLVEYLDKMYQENNPRGRPSKKEIAKELDKQVQSHTDIKDDWERITTKSIN